MPFAARQSLGAKFDVGVTKAKAGDASGNKKAQKVRTAPVLEPRMVGGFLVAVFISAVPVSLVASLPPKVCKELLCLARPASVVRPASARGGLLH